MSIRTVLVALLAVVCGGAAVFAVSQVVSRNPEPVAAKPDMVTIVVAATEIPRGKPITADMLGTKDYPKDYAPEGAVDEKKKDDILERVAAIPMVKDEPILEAKLASKKDRGAAALIPDGKRAYTITTSINSAVAGLIRPGDKVDVLLSMTSGQPSDQSGGATVFPLLQNVEIFAIEQHIEAAADPSKGDPNIRTVTLILTPDEANVVQLGQAKGTLNLTLRGSNDTKVAMTKPATLNGILGHQEKTSEPEVAPATLIPEGMRACTITATISSAVAGLLVPGNRVDVLCTTTNDLIKARTGGSSTKTLLENVGILAVDQRTADSKLDSNVRTVTLVVSPDDAAKVELGQTSGTLHLTLRNPKDKKSSNPKMAVFNDLHGFHDEEQSEPPTAAPMTKILTLKGTVGDVVERSDVPSKK